MDICLRERPETIEKLEELLIHHSYSYMQKLWDGERSAKEAEELQSDAVKLFLDTFVYLCTYIYIYTIFFL